MNEKENMCDITETIILIGRNALMERVLNQMEHVVRCVHKACCATVVTRWYWTIRCRRAQKLLEGYLDDVRDYDERFRD